MKFLISVIESWRKTILNKRIRKIQNEPNIFYKKKLKFVFRINSRNI